MNVFVKLIKQIYTPSEYEREKIINRINNEALDFINHSKYIARIPIEYSENNENNHDFLLWFQAKYNIMKISNPNNKYKEIYRGNLYRVYYDISKNKI